MRRLSRFHLRNLITVITGYRPVSVHASVHQWVFKKISRIESFAEFLILLVGIHTYFNIMEPPLHIFILDTKHVWCCWHCRIFITQHIHSKHKISMIRLRTLKYSLEGCAFALLATLALFGLTWLSFLSWNLYSYFRFEVLNKHVWCGWFRLFITQHIYELQNKYDSRRNSLEDWVFLPCFSYFRFDVWSEVWTETSRLISQKTFY